ncbi:MAG: DUF6670 family protein [Segniliparus sp.]|uniref:DUF6670 family protein n=1 Tax=Segniliparus sp. TaxID=2804064 RepID=UPI003F2F7D0C
MASSTNIEPQGEPLPNKALRAVARVVVDRGLPLIDRRIEESARPFARPDIFKPYSKSRRVAWTHYGVFVPLLPEPYRYLNTMTLIGATGTTVFDNDYLAAPDARDTATVLSSTAFGDQHHYRAYDASADCSFAEDGSQLAWGEDLTITSDYPSFTVRGRYGKFTVDLAVTATDQVSWFVRTPIYDHLSLLATFAGTIADHTGVVEVGGLCTVEYAKCASPQALSRKPLPPSLKLPVDFFTYQIVNLDERTQLLLTDVRADGAVAARLAHIRTVGGQACVYQDVDFEVLAYRDEPAIDERGRRMRVPERIRWTVRDGGEEIVRFEASVDSPLRYGHGRGYVGAYAYNGSWAGRLVSGSGYLEWVDCRPEGEGSGKGGGGVGAALFEPIILE